MSGTRRAGSTSRPARASLAAPAPDRAARRASSRASPPRRAASSTASVGVPPSPSTSQSSRRNVAVRAMPRNPCVPSLAVEADPPAAAPSGREEVERALVGDRRRPRRRAQRSPGRRRSGSHSARARSRGSEPAAGRLERPERARRRGARRSTPPAAGPSPGTGTGSARCRAVGVVDGVAVGRARRPTACRAWARGSCTGAPHVAPAVGRARGPACRAAGRRRRALRCGSGLAVEQVPRAARRSRRARRRTRRCRGWPRRSRSTSVEHERRVPRPQVGEPAAVRGGRRRAARRATRARRRPRQRGEPEQPRRQPRARRARRGGAGLLRASTGASGLRTAARAR